MLGRRKTDKILFFLVIVAVWFALLLLTKAAIYFGILIPIAHVTSAEKFAVMLILPTLAVIFTFGISYFLKSRDR